MSTPEIVILSNKSHPLYEKAKSLPFTFYDLERDDPFEGKEARYRNADAVFDLTLLDRERKEKLIRVLAVQMKAPVVTDLSCCWGDYFMTRYDNCLASMALSFWSPQGHYEFFTKAPEMIPLIELFLSAFGFKGVPTSQAGHGFIYPRVISQLINEAYFALEDKLATPQSLDTAMKFGVNYPLGLLEWSQKICVKPILLLLDDLFHVTKDQRYAASPELRRLANQP